MSPRLAVAIRLRAIMEVTLGFIGRGDRIRTCDTYVPNVEIASFHILREISCLPIYARETQEFPAIRDTRHR